MPVYLLHGFRWPRPLIRIHIILYNLDDAAAEWLVAPGTTDALLYNLRSIYPEAMEHLPNLRFIEQYDPSDLSAGAASQPYAYVADIVHEIRLGVDVEEVRGKGVSNEQWGSMLELRDRMAPEEKVGWFVVVCGDEERWAPPTMGLLNSGGHSSGNEMNSGQSGIVSYRSEAGSNHSTNSDAQRAVGTPTDTAPKGLKKWFSDKRSLSKRKSRTQIREVYNSDSSTSPPPLPGTAT